MSFGPEIPEPTDDERQSPREVWIPHYAWVWLFALIVGVNGAVYLINPEYQELVDSIFLKLNDAQSMQGSTEHIALLPTDTDVSSFIMRHSLVDGSLVQILIDTTRLTDLRSCAKDLQIQFWSTAVVAQNGTQFQFVDTDVQCQGNSIPPQAILTILLGNSTSTIWQ